MPPAPRAEPATSASTGIWRKVKAAVHDGVGQEGGAQKQKARQKQKQCVRVETAPVQCAGGYVHVYVDSGQGFSRANTHMCADPQRGWAGVQYRSTATKHVAAAKGCLRVVTGPLDTDAGDVYVMVDTGDGFKIANVASAGGSAGAVVMEQCYDTILGWGPFPFPLPPLTHTQPHVLFFCCAFG